jgi:hypothetical protein
VDRRGARRRRARRAALVAAVMGGSLWLLWQKLPERRAEGTKLMTALAQVYRPSMKVYMPPSSGMGIPRWIALDRGLPGGLQDVRDLSAGTRPQFLQEVERGEDFVFLLFVEPANDEMRGAWSIPRARLPKGGHFRAAASASDSRGRTLSDGRRTRSRRRFVARGDRRVGARSPSATRQSDGRRRSRMRSVARVDSTAASGSVACSPASMASGAHGGSAPTTGMPSRRRGCRARVDQNVVAARPMAGSCFVARCRRCR